MCASSPLPAQEKEPRPLALILLGPPGSGKGTQATLLKEALHLPHISTGDLLREHIRRDTELGREAKTFMDKGQLVPDPLILNMFFERIEAPDCHKGYILDGVPRTLPQAESVQSHLEKKAKIVVVNLSLNDDKVIERLANRLTCEKCGTSYHLLYSPPKHKGICDRCSGKLIQRSDDTETVIRERLNVYRKQTEPLIAFYTHLGLLHTIPCDQPKEKIYATLIAFL